MVEYVVDLVKRRDTIMKLSTVRLFVRKCSTSRNDVHISIVSVLTLEVSTFVSFGVSQAQRRS